jgi:hypothetical protein
MKHPQWDENSPYVWAFTNIYDGHGKYVADGHYDPNADEKQCGVMPVYFALRAMGGAGVQPAPVPPVAMPTKPAPAPVPAPVSPFARFLAALLRAFRR